MHLRDRQLAERLFLLTVVVYAWFYAGAGWNQNSQFDLTRAIVERHTFRIDAYASNTGDVSYHGGHIYSNKAPGISWLAAIPYAPLFWCESHPNDPVVVTLNMYICTVIVVGLLGALIPALLYRTARVQGLSARWSAVVALTTAFATQLFPYSTIFMLTVSSAALMLLALIVRRPWSAGLLAGFSVAVNYLAAPLILALLILWWPDEWRRYSSWKTLCALAAGVVVPLGALAVYNHICFGAITTSSLQLEDPRFLTPHAAGGVMNPPSLEALFGITISPYRGLFFVAPVLLMAIPGGVAAFRVRQLSARQVGAYAWIIGSSFFAITCFNGWDGGFGIGQRYLVPLVPLFGILMIGCRGLARKVFVALAIVSFAINFAAAAVDPEPSGTIPRPVTQYLFPLLLHGHFSERVPITPPWSAQTFTGHTSVNRMAPDEAIVFSHHQPGSAVAEWSSFNIGEAWFGPGDIRSLIPVLLLLVFGCIAIFRNASRIDAADEESAELH